MEKQNWNVAVGYVSFTITMQIFFKIIYNCFFCVLFLLSTGKEVDMWIISFFLYCFFSTLVSLRRYSLDLIFLLARIFWTATDCCPHYAIPKYRGIHFYLIMRNRKGWLQNLFFYKLPLYCVEDGEQTPRLWYTHNGAPIWQIIGQCRRTKVFICLHFIHHCLSSSSLHCHGSSEPQQTETDNKKSKQEESMMLCVNSEKVL